MSGLVRLSDGAAVVSTREQLRFQMDAAVARDAVFAAMDVEMLVRGLSERGLSAEVLRTAVTGGRAEYLRRPDLGRLLAVESAVGLQECEVVIVLADGLSALAVERHGLRLVDALLPGLAGVSVGFVVVTDARVAVGDEIGELMGAKMCLMLIGERPGLSAADSLGVYLTWEPRVGRTDAERNCVSNIRAEGLGYAEAATRILGLMRGARMLGATGVGLKDGDRSRVGLESGL
jgi:ethanolamine ammonia-lyase small subunit